MNKRVLLTTLCVALIAIIGVFGTVAYFTDTDDKENTFTVGNVDITLDEPKWDAAGKLDAPEVYPTEALAKDPTVTNVGANPCFVRIKVTGWDCLAPASDITYRTDYVDGILGENWVSHTDGYFYYTKVLPAGEVTDALFDQIVIPADLTNGDGEKIYTIDVKAEAVQAQGAKPSWSAVQTMTVEEIAAWFTTCMPAAE